MILVIVGGFVYFSFYKKKQQYELTPSVNNIQKSAQNEKSDVVDIGEIELSPHSRQLDQHDSIAKFWNESDLL